MSQDLINEARNAHKWHYERTELYDLIKRLMLRLIVLQKVVDRF